MENQTGFSLAIALREWRQELDSQLSLSPETRRELEAHLVDTLAELERRGLNDEESFWLARRRVGQLREVGREFAKTDDGRSISGLALRVALVCLGFRLWECLFNALWSAVTPRVAISNVWVAYPFLVYLPPILLAVFVVRGFVPVNCALCRRLTNSRRGFLLIAFFATSVVSILELWSELSWAYVSGSYYVSFAVREVYPALLISFICWLLPAKGKTKPASLAA